MRSRIDLNERLYLAEQQVIRARICYDIWWFYEGEETRRKIFEIMDEFSEFFRFDSHAHFVTFVVYMSALFESRTDTITIPSLVKEVEKSCNNKEDFTEISVTLSQASGLASKLTVIRNNLFGHRSAKFNYQDVFKKAAIAPDDLSRLTELALSVVQALRRIRGRNIMAFNPFPRSDIERILKILSSADLNEGMDENDDGVGAIFGHHLGA